MIVITNSNNKLMPKRRNMMLWKLLDFVTVATVRRMKIPVVMNDHMNIIRKYRWNVLVTFMSNEPT